MPTKIGKYQDFKSNLLNLSPWVAQRCAQLLSKMFGMNITLHKLSLHQLLMKGKAVFFLIQSNKVTTNLRYACSVWANRHNLSFTHTEPSYIWAFQNQLVRGTNIQQIHTNYASSHIAADRMLTKYVVSYTVANQLSTFWVKYHSYCLHEASHDAVQGPLPHLLLIKDPIRDPTSDCSCWVPS